MDAYRKPSMLGRTLGRAVFLHVCAPLDRITTDRSGGRGLTRVWGRHILRWTFRAGTRPHRSIEIIRPRSVWLVAA